LLSGVKQDKKTEIYLPRRMVFLAVAVSMTRLYVTLELLCYNTVVWLRDSEEIRYGNPKFLFELSILVALHDDPM